MPNNISNITKISLIFGTALMLVACGGGGNSNRSAIGQSISQIPPPPPPPTEPPQQTPEADEFRTPEYELSFGLEAINSAEAYTEGVTGAGITIGLLDFGFDLNTNELNLSSASVGRNQSFQAIYEAQIGQSASNDLHGHAVSVVAAGLKNDIDTHGVAFGANILAIDFFSGVNLAQFQSGSIQVNQSRGYEYLINNGARIVNKSIGFDEEDIISNPPVVDEVYIIDSEVNVVLGGGLLVASAGNNGDPEPALSNIRTYQELDDLGLIDNGPGAFLIVGAVDENLNIASFSDQAGNGPERNNFLVAPGVDVVAPFNGDLFFISGTSFAAPHVSGTAALILERWPFLTAREVAEIILTTATDLGAPGVDSIFGHGLVNAAETLRPQGETTVMSANGASSSVSGTAAVTGQAFGDASGLRAALATSSLIDSFGRDFQADFSSLVETGQTGLGLTARLQSKSDISIGATVFGRTRFSVFSIQNDDQVPFFARTGAAKEDLEPHPDIIFEFTGGDEAFSWSFGSGQAFGNSLNIASRENTSTALPSLSSAFSDPFNTRADSYFTSNLSLNPTLSLTTGFAIGENKGLKNHVVDALQEDHLVTEIAMGLSHRTENISLSYTLGVRRENGTLLGSRGSGGFNLVNSSDTLWMTFASSLNIGQTWSLSGEFTGGLTRADQVPNSLINDIGAIYTSSAALRLSKRELLSGNDQFGLTISQPLRAERAPIQLSQLSSRNADTGQFFFENARSSLTSSGREIALEGAYTLSQSNGWNWETALTRRFNAGHIRGISDTAVYFNLGRIF